MGYDACTKCRGCGITGWLWWAKKCDRCNGRCHEPPPPLDTARPLPPAPPPRHSRLAPCFRAEYEERIDELETALRESIEIFERVPVDIAVSGDVRRQINENRTVLGG